MTLIETAPITITPTRLPEVVIIQPRVFEDHRGFFTESYNQQVFDAAGITARFVQDNHAKSGIDTLRGLHFQREQPQGKLCRVVSGAVLDVAVDIRPNSPTLGQWVCVLLSAENRRQIWVPRGFAHGYRVLTPTAEFLYKCDAYYEPRLDAGIRWDDPTLNVDWTRSCLDPGQVWALNDPILSVKDQSLPYFR
jgi:dTDP-4-dehydrorhamnose 3,5-epimerase